MDCFFTSPGPDGPNRPDPGVDWRGRGPQRALVLFSEMIGRSLSALSHGLSAGISALAGLSAGWWIETTERDRDGLSFTVLHCVSE